MNIKEKIIRDTVKAAVYLLCHNIAADFKDVELTGDTGHVHAVSDDTQKVQETFEASEAEMPAQSWKESTIAIAVEENALQESAQRGSAIAAEEMKRAQKMYRDVLRETKSAQKMPK